MCDLSCKRAQRSPTIHLDWVAIRNARNAHTLGNYYRRRKLLAVTHWHVSCHSEIHKFNVNYCLLCGMHGGSVNCRQCSRVDLAVCACVERAQFLCIITLVQYRPLFGGPCSLGPCNVGTILFDVILRTASFLAYRQTDRHTHTHMPARHTVHSFFGRDKSKLNWRTRRLRIFAPRYFGINNATAVFRCLSQPINYAIALISYFIRSIYSNA